MIKHFENLSNNYLELLNDKEDFNVIINVGESPNIKSFQAHSAILKYRSPYFHNKLSNVIKDKNNIIIINFKNISIAHFEIIIKYIYGGICSLENLETPIIFELSLVAYEFLLDDLAKNLETYLIETKSSWLCLNFSRVYQISFKNSKCIEYQNWCNDHISKYPDQIFGSEYFRILKEHALISVIKRDDLQMEEVKIWNRIIEWGIAQHPNLPSDLRNWTNEDFFTLKNTLKNFLPHIRYFQMSVDDIIDNVRPYQQILEKDLWDDISIKFMSPNRQVTSMILPPRIISTPKPIASILPSKLTETFSLIINEKQAAEISSWIDRKNKIYSTTNNPYEFKLILRGTRDGFNSSSFWNLCDKQTNLVVIMKVKGTDEILGGYNPIGWDRQCSSVFGEFKYCKDGFIFSLKNGNIKNSILSRVKDPENAIYCVPYGPFFGGLYDLAMYQNFNEHGNCWNYQKFYDKRIRNASTYDNNMTSYFSVEEYEIFQISKKIL